MVDDNQSALADAAEVLSSHLFLEANNLPRFPRSAKLQFEN
jgi:hypothetical protein